MGIPEDKALSGAKSVLFKDLTIFGLIFIIAVVSAWYLVGLLIANPVKRLITATNRFRQGEEDEKISLPHN